MTTAHNLTGPADDLAWILDQIHGDAVFDPDSDPGAFTPTEEGIYATLLHLKHQVLIRQAVKAGPRDVAYCGVDNGLERACGPDLGLPRCAYHARVDAR